MTSVRPPFAFGLRQALGDDAPGGGIADHRAMRAADLDALAALAFDLAAALPGDDAVALRIDRGHRHLGRRVELGGRAHRVDAVPAREQSIDRLQRLAVGRRMGLASTSNCRTSPGCCFASSRAITPPRLWPMSVTLRPWRRWTVASRVSMPSSAAAVGPILVPRPQPSTA